MLTDFAALKDNKNGLVTLVCNVNQRFIYNLKFLINNDVLNLDTLVLTIQMSGISSNNFDVRYMVYGTKNSIVFIFLLLSYWN